MNTGRKIGDKRAKRSCGRCHGKGRTPRKEGKRWVREERWVDCTCLE